MNKHFTAPTFQWKAVPIGGMWAIETQAGKVVTSIGNRGHRPDLAAALIADAPELLRELAFADALLHEALNLLSSDQVQRLGERAACIHEAAGVIRANERERLLLKHCRRAGL